MTRPFPVIVLKVFSGRNLDATYKRASGRSSLP